jgi:hypothetical protein
MNDLTDTALIAEREQVKAEFPTADELAHEVVRLRRLLIEARNELHGVAENG